MGNKFYRFMLGRYGMDKLGYAILIASMIVTFISSVFRIPGGIYPAYALIIWEVFRFLSKDTRKRSQENLKFINFRVTAKNKCALLKNKIRDRKTHRYFQCTTCHNTLRVPKGHGEVKVTCPVCKTVTIIKT